MIYLFNMPEAQVLFVPRVLSEAPKQSLSLRIEGTVSHKVFTMDVIDLGTSGIYHNLSVALPDGIETGEYEYKILDGNVERACGLLMIGEFKNATKDYNKSVQYEQYECD